MEPVSFVLGLLALVGAFKVGIKATADGYATVKAAQSGAFDFIDADRQRRAGQREKLAAAWAARRAKRSREAGGGGSFRPGAREYGRDLWHGFWEDKLDHRAKKREARPEWVYDPDRKPWHVRFDEAVLDKVQRARESRGWDMTKAAARMAGRRFVGPVGEKPADPAPVEEQEEPATAEPPAREDDNAGWFDPAHLSGDADEDMLVRTAGCPYLVVAGRDPAHYCAANRSPHEGDHPYCREHAASIRDDRGRGGYVAPAGDVDDHLPLEPTNPTNTPTASTGGTAMPRGKDHFVTAVADGWSCTCGDSEGGMTAEDARMYADHHAEYFADHSAERANQTSTPTASTGGTTMTAPIATEVNNNEDARRAFQQQIDVANQAEEALSVYEAAQQRLFGTATAGLDGLSAKRFDTQAQAAQANAADLLPQSDMSQAAAAIEGIRASAEAGLAALDKYRDSEQLVNDNNVDGRTLETASSS